jgi:hypothetical protein
LGGGASNDNRNPNYLLTASEPRVVAGAANGWRAEWADAALIPGIGLSGFLTYTIWAICANVQ